MGCVNERPSFPSFANADTQSSSPGQSSSNILALPQLVFNSDYPDNADKQSYPLTPAKQNPSHNATTSATTSVNKKLLFYPEAAHYGEDSILFSIQSNMTQASTRKSSDQSDTETPPFIQEPSLLPVAVVATTEQPSSGESKSIYSIIGLIGQNLQVADENSISTSRTQSFDFSKKIDKLMPACQAEKEQYLRALLKDSYSHSRDDFNRLLRRGPKQELRWMSWRTKLVNLQEYHKFFRFEQKNMYEAMLCPQQDSQGQQRSSDILYLINKDTARTFPELKYFESLGQQQLRRTLQAISNFFKNIGYCQGMNFIIGMLLLVNGGNEIETFECFISLSFRKEFMLVGMFEAGFPLLKYLEIAFDDIFAQHLPKLKAHFASQDVSNQIWLTKWLMTLYLYSFPLPICVRIVDFMISTDVFALVYVAVEILRQLEDKLLQMEGIDISMFFSEKLQDSTRSINESIDNATSQQANNRKTIAEMIDINAIIQKAHKLKIKSNKKKAEYAERAKEQLSKDFCAHMDFINQNDSGSDSSVKEYTKEFQNVMFFIEYFTLQGSDEKQEKYLDKIKEKYINKSVKIREKKQHVKPAADNINRSSSWAIERSQLFM